MFIYNEKFKSKKEGYYYSCPWIEHGLVFFPHKLAFCCHCGHEGGGRPVPRRDRHGDPAGRDAGDDIAWGAQDRCRADQVLCERRQAGVCDLRGAVRTWRQ